jgi:hypothetical protein
VVPEVEVLAMMAEVVVAAMRQGPVDRPLQEFMQDKMVSQKVATAAALVVVVVVMLVATVVRLLVVTKPHTQDTLDQT